MSSMCTNLISTTSAQFYIPLPYFALFGHFKHNFSVFLIYFNVSFYVFLFDVYLFVYIFVYMFVQQQQQQTTIVFSGLGGGRIWEKLQTGKTQSKYIV